MRRRILKVMLIGVRARGYCHLCYMVVPLLRWADPSGDEYYVLSIHALLNVRCPGSLDRPLLLE